MTKLGTYRVKYILRERYECNKGVLEYILGLFSKEMLHRPQDSKAIMGPGSGSLGAVTQHHNTPNIWLLYIIDNNCKYILSYYNKYKLISKKIDTYNMFRDILVSDSINLNDIKYISKSMGNINRALQG